MSAFHRIDDVRAMPAPRFITFALRLFAYKGILRALVEAEQIREARGETVAQPTRASAPPTTGGDIRQNRVIDSTEANLMTDPAFKGLFEKGGTDG
jgi:hypothetical protein